MSADALAAVLDAIEGGEWHYSPEADADGIPYVDVPPTRRRWAGPWKLVDPQ